MLWIWHTTETLTSILPYLCREQEGWDLTEVEVVNNAQRLRSHWAGAERAGEGFAFALGQRQFNPLRRRFAETCGIDIAEHAPQGALGFHNPLPDCLGAGQEPRRRQRQRVWLASELAERDTNDVRHPFPPVTEKLHILH